MKIVRPIILLCVLSSRVLAAEPTGAARLGKMLADPGKDACISLTTESELWRDATAADYTSSGWAAWLKVVRNDAPWQAKGDFDGDGLQDLAKVIVDKAGKRWMMGVMFGHADGAPCHRYQISGKDLGTMPIAGVLTLPKGTDQLTCHHMGEQGPVSCKVSADEPFAKRTTDAILTFDDVPSYSTAYLWQPNLKPDSKSRGEFDAFDVAMEADLAGMAAQSKTVAMNTHAGDRVGAAERKRLVQEFEQAWAGLANTSNYRSTTRSQMSGTLVEGDTSRTTVEVADATHSRTTIESGGTTVKFLRSDKKTWNSMDGTTWTALPDADGSATTPMFSPIGDATITAVRNEARDGRAVKVLELSGVSQATLVLDVARRLPLQRIDKLTMGAVTTVTRTDYEYDIKVEIEPPATR